MIPDSSACREGHCLMPHNRRHQKGIVALFAVVLTFTDWQALPLMDCPSSHCGHLRQTAVIFADDDSGICGKGEFALFS